MPLFEVAIIEVTKHDKKPDEEELVLSPKSVLAKTEQAAATKTLLDNAEALKERDHDKLNVLVRPFG